jgi:hypothetical protein
MILYLCNTRPDAMFATSQCARYRADPRHSHKVALKRIGRYLKGTRTRGLVLNGNGVDADFAGLHGLGLAGCAFFTAKLLVKLGVRLGCNFTLSEA